MTGKTKAAIAGGNHRGAERMNYLPPTRILGEPVPIVNYYRALRRQAEKKMDAAEAAGDNARYVCHWRVWLVMLNAEKKAGRRR